MNKMLNQYKQKNSKYKILLKPKDRKKHDIISTKKI